MAKIGVGVEGEGEVYRFFALNVPLHGCDLLDNQFSDLSYSQSKSSDFFKKF